MLQQNALRDLMMTFDADGVPWSLKLISHARAEIEDARALRDSEVQLAPVAFSFVGIHAFADYRAIAHYWPRCTGEDSGENGRKTSSTSVL